MWTVTIKTKTNILTREQVIEGTQQPPESEDKINFGDWIDGSAVKNVYCSGRRPTFSSQDPCWVAQKHL